MIPNSGFKASDADRQTADSATNYMNRALRMLAERLGWEKSLERDPAGFAVQFAPLLSALIDAQAREYQSMVLNSIDWSLLSGLSDIAELAGDSIPGLCLKCSREGMRALRAEMAAENGE